MSLPFFYIDDLRVEKKEVTVDEANSKHIINVLRMAVGDELVLTDGKGKKAYARIIDDNRKKCRVELLRVEEEKMRLPMVAIGISLLKNIARFEWFLEKATEIGVNSIIPLICHRTQSEKFRMDRMQTILVSAMLQSQQSWLPALQEPVRVTDVIKSSNYPKKLIAHCVSEEKISLNAIRSSDDSIILIGPEGDFTPEEINNALNAGFNPVTLGENRLRTETAGIAAAVMLRLQQ
jgi:16S rRNA (uracil1498-N3)-methyltransferase